MCAVLLTGASGFIGSKLVDTLKEDKKDVVLLTSKPIEGTTCILHNNYSFRKSDFWEQGINCIDTVIHLGWHVPQSNDTNVRNGLGGALFNTIDLLENLPNIPKRVVYCSSVSVYGRCKNVEYKPREELIHEDWPVQPDDDYSISKYIGELIVRDWGRRNNVDVLILRIAPTFGPGDKRKDEFIARIIHQATNNDEIKLFADASMKRNLMYRDDLCDFICRAIDIPDGVGLINVVSDSNPSMINIIKTVIAESKSKSKVNVMSGKCFGQDLAFDSKKRKYYLGEEKNSLASALKHMLD